MPRTVSVIFMKRLLVLFSAVVLLSVSGLISCTENPSDPDIEQNGGNNDGDNSGNQDGDDNQSGNPDDEDGKGSEGDKTDPEPDPEPEPAPEDIPLTGLKLSVSSLMFGVGDRHTVDVTTIPADASFDIEEFVLVNDREEASQFVSIAERNVTDKNVLELTLRDRRTTEAEYNETLYIVHEPTGVASEPLSVCSVPVAPPEPPAPETYVMPVVRITTSTLRGSITKDIWVDGEIEIEGGAFGDLARMKTQVKGRGNSTWEYPKKPYALKLDKKQEVLGMPKHKRWCLIANWIDLTHMRNRLAYHIGQNTRLAWTPRNEYAEVYFNGEYLGIYLVTEQIKVDENRVDVPELASSDISGDAVTGGYLLELDTYYDEAYKFRTSSTNIPVNLKSPDENVPAAQMNYIRDYMNAADAAMLALWNGTGSAETVYKYIDAESMADYWIVCEVMTNYEILHPKSLYLHKDRNGKLVAGPLWDFDYATMVPSRAQRWGCYGLSAVSGYVEWSWYERCWWNILLMRDPSFRSLVKQRWQELYPFLQSLPAFIESEREKIAEAVARNNSGGWTGWGGVNEESGLSFDAAVTRLKTTCQTRISWLNTEINKW